MRRIFLILLLFSSGALAEKPGLDLKPSVKDFVVKYCYECHDEDTEKGDVRLDNLSSRIDNSSTALVWQDILDVLNSGDMPPKKAKQPEVTELSSAIGFLTEDLLKARKILTDQGGEIVIRRLNKREYINTVKSLTGIELPARLVPDDEVSEGFNTMGGNQYFSPSLIDRYMELAELALSKIILEGDKKHDKRRDIRRDLHAHIKKQLNKNIDKFTKKFENAKLVINEKHDYKKYGFSDEQEARHSIQNYNGITTLMKHYLTHESIKEKGFLLMQRAHHKESISTKADFRARYILKMNIAVEEGMPEEDSFLEVSQNDKLLGYYYIHGTLDNPQRLEIEVRPEIDVKSLKLEVKQKENNRLPNTYYQGRLTKRVNNGEVIPAIWVEALELEGPFYTDEFNHRKADILNGVIIDKATDGELASLFKKFAEKAFRGATVSDEFLSHLISVYHQEISFKKSKLESLIKPLAIVLTSPGFLFLGEEKEAGVQRKKLNGRELATRLSYTLWKNMPDETLLMNQHKLENDKEFYKNQIAEMMQDHRFKAFVEELFGQWLHLEKYDSIAFSTKRYSNFDQGLILSSKNEVFEFINTVIQEDLSLGNLIDSDFAVVNPMMAQYYGLPVNKSNEFQKVKLPQNMAYRGGLLGKAAIQAMGTTGERNSPVERGAFIL
ncbi:MAG: DUF1592 domain-containing protein, partial [Lentisphaeraceae bacterium]|nr:DUF1592 domain-containing protein [Lentisphaeraceae bacterium]